MFADSAEEETAGGDSSKSNSLTSNQSTQSAGVSHSSQSHSSSTSSLSIYHNHSPKVHDSLSSQFILSFHQPRCQSEHRKRESVSLNKGNINSHSLNDEEEQQSTAVLNEQNSNSVPKSIAAPHPYPSPPPSPVVATNNLDNISNHSASSEIIGNSSNKYPPTHPTLFSSSSFSTITSINSLSTIVHHPDRQLSSQASSSPLFPYNNSSNNNNNHINTTIGSGITSVLGKIRRGRVKIFYFYSLPSPKFLYFRYFPNVALDFDSCFTPFCSNMKVFFFTFK